jgi:GGDEF domain-containing protein
MLGAFQSPGTAAADLIRQADQAMYLAKQAGGNRFAGIEANLQAG